MRDQQMTHRPDITPIDADSALVDMHEIVESLQTSENPIAATSAFLTNRAMVFERI